MFRINILTIVDFMQLLLSSNNSINLKMIFSLGDALNLLGMVSIIHFIH